MATSQDRLASVVERVQRKFPNFMLQTQVLRREVLLNGNNNNYKFSLKSGSGNNPNGESGEEVFLDGNDAFVLCGLSIAIKKVDTSFTVDRYGNYPIFTYPDPQVFVGAPANRAKEYEALQCVWNGQLSFRTNTLQRIKAMDASKFQFTPPTQVINAVATSNVATQAYAGNGLTNPRLPEYGGWDWESQGFIELLPAKILDGSENNQFELSLANGDILAIDGSYASDGDQDATARNYLVLRAYGVLIPDGSKAAKQFSSSWDLMQG